MCVCDCVCVVHLRGPEQADELFEDVYVCVTMCVYVYLHLVVCKVVYTCQTLVYIYTCMHK